ncbi:MAG: 50S ribosomal protein L32e [Thermoplasmata archaeon]
MDPSMERIFKIKLDLAKSRPLFRRQEWFRYKKLGSAWRKPKGKHSKMREHRGYRPPIVDSGFRGPKKVRYLHPSGYRDVLVHNLKELEKLNAEKDAVRIASNVGNKKKKDIYNKAKELGLKVLNYREVQ